jgi:hypothetical protein
MIEQSARDTILKNTLQVLVAHVDLSPAELVQLRLSDLHLAGKSPNISFIPAGSDDPSLLSWISKPTALWSVGWSPGPIRKAIFCFPVAKAGRWICKRSSGWSKKKHRPKNPALRLMLLKEQRKDLQPELSRLHPPVTRR